MSRRRMTSSLLDLPSGILEQVNDMIIGVGADRKTYDEITIWLAEQGHRKSRSSVGRYAQKIIALDKVKMAGEIAKSLVEDVGDDPLRIEEATAKLGAVLVMEAFTEAMRGDKPDLKYLFGLVSDFAKLQQSSVNREKFKADMKKKLEKAFDKAVSASGRQGAGAMTIDALRDAITKELSAR